MSSRYEREIKHMFDQPISMLELGVQRGGSMLLWRDIFEQGSIAGLDLNPISVPDDSGRIHIYQGFQQDPEVLDRLSGEVAPGGFDLIIDDASHIGRYTAESFWHLFPNHLKRGGVYVLEDWSCAYLPEWTDGHQHAAVHDVGAASTATAGRIEAARRQVRSSARKIAARLESYPDLRSRLRELYMKTEGATLQRRFPSHDYGMAGFTKQLVDVCALDGQAQKAVRTGEIARISVTPSQVFVHKL